MELTIAQQVLVAKDRAMDELTEINNDAHGFWNLDPERMTRAMQIGLFIGLDNDQQSTLDMADKLGFINGEEDMFWQKPHETDKATCEHCGNPCKYDSEICLCASCEEKAGL